jgi:hypothetical protein
LTRRDNLALTCRRHNQAKAAGTGWSYQHNPDGSFTWTTHTGHHYTSPTTRPWTRNADGITPWPPAVEQIPPDNGSADADPPS